MPDTATKSSETTGCEAVSALSDKHELFKPFVGTFKARVRMWMGPGDPMESTGVMTNDLDLGGRFLKQSYTGDPGAGPFPDFQGRGFWGYNTLTNQFEGVWIDTACTFMQTEVGDVDSTGKVWTMTSEMVNPEHPGETMEKKSVVKLIDDNHYTMEMFFNTGEGDKKTMEIDYRRA